MGQEPGFSTLLDPASHASWWLDRSGMVLPGSATPGTPPLPRPTLGTPDRMTGVQGVLWALNEECVTLKWTLKSILGGLSGFWLLF